MAGALTIRSAAIPARENPFRVERVLTFRYRLGSMTWDELEAQWEALERRAAIVGPKGAGKTTLLEDLAERFRLSGRSVACLQLRSETRRDGARLVDQLFSEANPNDILLVDGAEQLGPLSWRRLKRRSHAYTGLIITTHQPGRLPTLMECRTSVERLEEMVATLAPEWLDELNPVLDELYRRYDGNLRLCVRALYDLVACSPNLDPGVMRVSTAQNGQETQHDEEA